MELGGHITLFKNTDQKGREEAVIRKGQWIEEGMAFFPPKLGGENVPGYAHAHT